MVKSLKRCKSLLGLVVLLPIVFGACSERPAELPADLQAASGLLNGKWSTACLQNPQQVADPDTPIGYVRETLEFLSLTATQTLEYFQDPNCVVATTAGQVANQNETFFLLKQSQLLSLDYPTGKTSTALGEASFLNLQVESVSIDDVLQTDEQLRQKGITLPTLLGLFIVTESDRLHLATAVETRPVNVPLDSFYERTTE